MNTRECKVMHRNYVDVKDAIDALIKDAIDALINHKDKN